MAQSIVLSALLLQQNQVWVWVVLEIFEMQSVVNLVLRLNRFTKTEVVVSLLQNVEVDLLIGFYELRCFWLALVRQL